MKTEIKNLLERNKELVFKNLHVEKLVETALKRGEGILAANKALVTRTGARTGRSPNDRFIVEDSWSSERVFWGNVNKKVSKETFNAILNEAVAYLTNKERFVFEGFVGADPKYRMALRAITEKAWHTLFATTLFIRPTKEELSTIDPEFTVIDATDLKLDWKKYGLNSETFVGISFEDKIILAVGTGYGGEIKKSIFSVMNGLLPEKGILPMHCSANVGKNNDVALFFGLSGTGKTTLSADPARRLIGDDEHGWSNHGVFNFEGGCYAKVIKLSKEAEPQIFNAIRSGSIIENVIYDEKTLEVDYDSDQITENTRATYPVEHIPNCVIPGVGGIPKNIFFLTCDAFGVLPPISKLDPAMAMYHFLSGYTAKLAGTEVGVKEPTATFSACFGAPFLPLHPTKYAELLGKKLKESGAKCWLVNSGWSGGAFGVGSRMKISITRALLTAALNGTLDNVSYVKDPLFNILIPSECPHVPKEVLTPKNTWNDKAAYDKKAKELAERFIKNFSQYKDFASKEIIAAGPLL